MKTSDIRHGAAQTKYRGQSKAKDLSTKHCAHYFSLEIAVFLHEHVEPSVDVETMKRLCNEPLNFRIVSITTNRSTHRAIDKELMKNFEQLMLSEFSQTVKYKQWFKSNPSKLELEIIANRIGTVKLKGQSAQRAKAQAVRVQKLQFPNHYTAFARLFYRSFRDTKNRHIWNDSGNSAEFRQYLKQQQQQQDPGVLCKNKKGAKGKSNVQQDEEYGTDDQGRTLYLGPKDGVYYIYKTKLGGDGKRYVDETKRRAKKLGLQ
eukprot:CAMPEP_0197056898 /NCGR_PEP_ID=MMETSP1384-20130603/90968_1 /TAXON_ID=29189 /ORGANISM="Ammonia sp." /LENGTH=260 /DNA_ID=CAMNT_0042491085 /DNA_START=97 /DNA_END=879 /DNA_ORIENTATION=+